MKYSIKRIVCGAYQENAYLLCPEAGEGALLIDPGDDLPSLQRAIRDSGRRLTAILLTHGHFDHALAAKPLSDETGARVYVHPADEEMLTDPKRSAYDEGCATLRCPNEIEVTHYADALDIEGLHFEIIHTPGHTKGSICLYDAENELLFSGDTLFYMGFGRFDLPGGSAHELRDSLRRLFALPADTQVLSGHGEETDIEAESGRYRL